MIKWAERRIRLTQIIYEDFFTRLLAHFEIAKDIFSLVNYKLIMGYNMIKTLTVKEQGELIGSGDYDESAPKYMFGDPSNGVIRYVYTKCANQPAELPDVIVSYLVQGKYKDTLCIHHGAPIGFSHVDGEIH